MFSVSASVVVVVAAAAAAFLPAAAAFFCLNNTFCLGTLFFLSQLGGGWFDWRRLSDGDFVKV